jgi:hypothetical protein
LIFIEIKFYPFACRKVNKKMMIDVVSYGFICC